MDNPAAPAPAATLSPAPTAAPVATPTPAIDVQAEITKALDAHKATFAAEFEKATGHKDLGAFTEAKMKEQGQLQELADKKSNEAATWRGKFETAAIHNAILAAAGESQDPDTVKQLLSGKGQVDADGIVTIDGKSPADAVKQLLTEKPFLLKPTGNAGSGAPQTTGSGKALTRAAFDALSPADKQAHFKHGGVVTD